MIYEAIDIWNSPSLEHHGVKGMKWGVRKTVRRIGRAASKANFNIEKRLYNRGKKLTRRGYNDFSTFGNGWRAVSSLRASRFVEGLAKESYMRERLSGVLSKPSNTTVGLAAASVALTTYGMYLASSTIVNDISYNFYKRYKNDSRFANKRKKK